jgi:hydrogenase nickel incorporation protein HypA/HybF
MHELAIAEGIADVVATRAGEHHATRVTSVRLRIGAASGVVPDSLTFCFEMLASENPLLAGARLAVETVPHRAHCRGCDRDFAVSDYIAECPDCGAWSDLVVSGGELQVLEMEIETGEEAG